MVYHGYERPRKVGSFLNLDIGGFSTKLDANEIALREEFLEDLGLSPPVEGFYEPESPRKPFFFDEDRRAQYIVEPGEEMDSHHHVSLVRGYAIFSSENPYLEEIYRKFREGETVILNMTEIPRDSEKYSSLL